MTCVRVIECGSTPAERMLSCWAWLTGSVPTFEFGAHDFGGSSDDPFSVDQEVVRGDADGALEAVGPRSAHDGRAL